MAELKFNAELVAVVQKNDKTLAEIEKQLREIVRTEMEVPTPTDTEAQFMTHRISMIMSDMASLGRRKSEMQRQLDLGARFNRI